MKCEYEGLMKNVMDTGIAMISCSAFLIVVLFICASEGYEPVEKKLWALALVFCVGVLMAIWGG